MRAEGEDRIALTVMALPHVLVELGNTGLGTERDIDRCPVRIARSHLKQLLVVGRRWLEGSDPPLVSHVRPEAAVEAAPMRAHIKDVRNAEATEESPQLHRQRVWSCGGPNRWIEPPAYRVVGPQQLCTN